MQIDQVTMSQTLVPLKTKAGHFRKKFKTSHLNYLETFNSPKTTIHLIDLPVELINKIFDRLDIKTLSRLTLLSKSLRDLVSDYCIRPRSGYQRLMPNNLRSNECCFLHPEDDNDESKTRHVKFFCNLGLLIKRLTCLFPTDDRLNLMIEFMGKVTNGLPSHYSMQKSDNNQSFVLKCFGTFLHTLITGWTESECIKVFHFLQKKFKLDQVVSCVLDSLPGEKNWCEYFVRCFYRHICLDRSRCKEDQIFWLSMILEKHCYEDLTENNPIRNVARLLIILFGPLVRDEDQGLPMIAWSELTTCFFIKELNLLGYHIQIFKLIWTDAQIFDLINNIIILPEQWSPENVASLLYLCGEKIVKAKLLQHFLERDMCQAANMIVYQTLVTHKLLNGAVNNSILDLIEECFTTQAANELKKELILALPRAFTDAYAEIDHLVDVEDERDSDDLLDIVSAMNSLMLALFVRHYSSIFCPGIDNSPLVITHAKYLEQIE